MNNKAITAINKYLTKKTNTQPYADVVTWLLAQQPSAELVPIQGAESMPCREGLIPNTLRFYPVDTGTSGLFIAKIRKKGTGQEEEKGGQVM